MAIDAVLSAVSTQDLGIQSLFSVVGKVAVVTGGSSGLGSYSAMALALAGAKVYLVARREDKMKDLIHDFNTRAQGQVASKEAKQGSMKYIISDLSNKEGIKSLIDAFSSKEDHLDILVHNSGIHKFPASYPVFNDPAQRAKAMWDVEWSDWQETMDINTISAYYLAVGFAPLLCAAPKASFSTPGPVVIMNTSLSAFSNTGDLPLHYPASKAAAEKLTKLLAGGLKCMGIRLNSVACGCFLSDMIGDASAEDTPLQKFMKTSLTPRFGSVTDYAGTVLYLCSQAGAYLNGITILLDGGVHQVWTPHTNVILP